MKRALMLSLLLLAAGGAHAEPPDGEYTISATGANALRVPGAGSALDRTVRGVVVSTSLSLAANVLGGVIGVPASTTDRITLAAPGLAGTLPLEVVFGFLSGTNERPKAVVVFQISPAGEIVDDGFVYIATGSGALRCRLDKTEPNALECRGAVSVRATTDGGATVGNTTLPIRSRVALVERPFELELDLETDADGLVTGTAALVFAEGTLPRAVTGKYDAGSDTATLKLVGLDTGNKIVIKRATFAEGAVTGGKVAYKIGGMKGAIELD